MFSAVLSSGLSFEKTPLPLSMNLLSNQKLDKTQWNTIYMTYIQQFCWLLDTRAIIKFEKFIWKVETSKLNVLQLSTHTCTCLFFLLDCCIWCLCSIKPSLHLENGMVVCYIDSSVNFWSRRAEGGISIKRCLLLWNPQIGKTLLKAHFHQCMTVFWHLR